VGRAEEGWAPVITYGLRFAVDAFDAKASREGGKAQSMHTCDQLWAAVLLHGRAAPVDELDAYRPTEFSPSGNLRESSCRDSGCNVPP